ncbi:hypothetical protein AB4Z42_16455 [Mycobacterium sp. 2YAF39]|uniref:hypothetical protein n=1 Tax=Mycobacterium sp. 2YAF39 TaxID=3233033 RepID=UPI003F961A00
MKKLTLNLLVGISAIVALGTLSACSGGSSNQAASSSEAPTATTSSAPTAFPESARYIADMTAADGKTMTIGISVEGDEVAAYACNGTDDEAWFFGNQTDGSIDIKSRFRDTLQAEFDGGNVAGDLNMNGVAYQFTAKPATGAAGMYTAELDGARASWVLRDDGSAVGVQINGAVLDAVDVQQLNDAQFRAQVRNKRQLQQAQQITRLSNGSMSSKINGRDVTPTLVTGSFRLG